MWFLIYWVVLQVTLLICFVEEAYIYANRKWKVFGKFWKKIALLKWLFFFLEKLWTENKTIWQQVKVEVAHSSNWKFLVNNLNVSTKKVKMFLYHRTGKLQRGPFRISVSKRFFWKFLVLPNFWVQTFRWARITTKFQTIFLFRIKFVKRPLWCVWIFLVSRNYA